MIQVDAAKLKGLRICKFGSREKLAKKADVSIYTVGRIESGGKGITLDTLSSLALALEVSIDDLLVKEDEGKGERHE